MNKLEKYVRRFGEPFTVVDSSVYCSLCDSKLNVNRPTQIKQHINTAKHQTAIANQGESDKDEQDEFTRDLFHALVKSDIAPYKMSNASFRNFISKWTKRSVPSESTIRRQLKCEFDQGYSKIIEHFKDKKIWLSIDESQDIMGQNVIAVLGGILDGVHESSPILLNIQFTDQVNHAIIFQCINDTLKLIWPNGIEYNSFLLFLTDAAPYMKKAAEGMKVLYPKMLHVTCLAHGLHRVCETIRGNFSKVDQLISEGKKVFLKAKSRQNLLKSLKPNLTLPPRPVTTRWGTWLNAINYYHDNYQDFKEVVMILDDDDAAAIVRLKSLLNDPNITYDIAFIRNNFLFIADVIRDLQAENLSILRSLQILNVVNVELAHLNDSIGNSIKNKFNYVLNNNPDLHVIREINNIINFSQYPVQSLSYDANELTAFKFAPLTTAAIERCFSKYKAFLRENRLSFNQENLKMYFILNYNGNQFV